MPGWKQFGNQQDVLVWSLKLLCLWVSNKITVRIHRMPINALQYLGPSCKFNNSWSNALTIYNYLLSKHLEIYASLCVYLPVFLPCVFLDLSSPSIRLSTIIGPKSTNIKQSISINLNRSTIRQSIYPSVCLTVPLSIHQKFYLSIYQPWYLCRRAGSVQSSDVATWICTV